MRGAAVAVFVALSYAAMAQEQAASNVIVARGVLSRSASDTDPWTLKVDESLRFRDEAILEENAGSKRPASGVLILTYERDSIWEIKGVMPIDPAEIDVPSRIIHTGSTSYRYQEVVPNDVVKLLDNPMGTIPISRPLIRHKLVPGASMSDLTADFRALVSTPR